MIVDLERHRAIELLPDRAAETVAIWLRAHPGVKIVTRDRSMEYARGILMGAPQALQVLVHGFTIMMIKSDPIDGVYPVNS